MFKVCTTVKDEDLGQLMRILTNAGYEAKISAPTTSVAATSKRIKGEMEERHDESKPDAGGWRNRGWSDRPTNRLRQQDAIQKLISFMGTKDWKTESLIVFVQKETGYAGKSVSNLLRVASNEGLVETPLYGHWRITPDGAAWAAKRGIKLVESNG